MLRTVTQRLTLWYSLLFAVLAIIASTMVYTNLVAHLQEHTDKQLRTEVKEMQGIYQKAGIAGLRTEFLLETHATGKSRVFFRLLNGTGEVLAASDLGDWKGLAFPPVTTIGLLTLSVPDRLSGVRMIAAQLASDKILQMGYTLQDNEKSLEAYRETFWAALLVTLFCGGLASYFISRRAMAGVERVTRAADRIRQGDLSHQVPLGNEGEEIDRLARAFNSMQQRITSLIGELKEVINNIAHDLRSPLTRIRGVAETTLTRGTSLAEYREMAGMVVEESDRLVGIVNTLLEIAETDSGVIEIAKDPVDMAGIIDAAVELFLPVAEDKRIRLVRNTAASPCCVRGDVGKLQRLMANLIDNAIKYTPADGNITVTATAATSRLMISVKDSGIGIAAKDLPFIFDRFYRSDDSRSTPGNGLGLSLVQAIVHAHGGEITVVSHSGAGSEFTVFLPRIASLFDDRITDR